LLQGMIEADLRARLTLPEIASSANKFLCTRELDLKYATLVIACLRPGGELEYVNCGHIPPLVAKSGGGVVRLREHNVPVGLLSSAEFASAGFRLSPGDRLIMVTDGITEAENADRDFFGDQRLEESAQGERPLEEILDSVRLFCQGRPIQDDCTILELACVCENMLTPQSAAATFS
jgi:sigma-B regulation protein RsbU (phosphoserine phosphatase)